MDKVRRASPASASASCSIPSIYAQRLHADRAWQEPHARLAQRERHKQFDPDALCEEYLGYAAVMKPHIKDTVHLLHQAIKQGKRLMFEAAQGGLLDVDHGTYPYVTSSNSSTTGIWSGSGVPARNLTRIIGIIKAYTSRVGRGPFPTELDDGPTGIGETIRKIGREYGTVTGRPRRCGWLDAVAVRLLQPRWAASASMKSRSCCSMS